ncbi:hypothetical protein AAIR29_03295 [Psychrobacter sp. FBL11]|uniref:Sel1 repeat family protein n=1 Tax=Psychrobacter saeujeotis TaxID=3143436 RepID=A0ABU9X5H0_9GAMM|nr:hypothetical protein [uncultured Psychrobacter sp.]
MSQPISPIKHNKSAALTALAAACTLMLSAPALAATPDTAAAPAVSANAPSAIDSSKRIIRRAQPNATISNAQSSNAPSSPSDAKAAEQTTEQDATQQNRATASTQQTPYTPVVPVAPKPTGTTQVYQRGPITSTGIDISAGQLNGIPTPQVRISDISFVPTLLISQKTGLGTDKLDVSLLDDFIEDVSPNARHYPPNFPNRSQRHYTREKIKVLTEWIEPYASEPDASFDVLLRAAKLNGMGRNLDLGSEYAVRAGQYVDRAIKAKPDSGEANFLYGMMLSEGGGFKEGKKYLDKAVELGYTEAEQSLAQSDLLSDRRNEALDRLRRLEQRVPDNSIIRQQIKLIEDGKYYIWDLPAPDIDVKPNTPIT